MSSCLSPLMKSAAMLWATLRRGLHDKELRHPSASNQQEAGTYSLTTFKEIILQITTWVSLGVDPTLSANPGHDHSPWLTHWLQSVRDLEAENLGKPGSRFLIFKNHEIINVILRLFFFEVIFLSITNAYLIHCLFSHKWSLRVCEIFGPFIHCLSLREDPDWLSKCLSPTFYEKGCPRSWTNFICGIDTV